ncbi:MAG TPA: hypothetical protein VF104_08760 [Burkholderiales bacterium]
MQKQSFMRNQAAAQRPPTGGMSPPPPAGARPAPAGAIGQRTPPPAGMQASPEMAMRQKMLAARGNDMMQGGPPPGGPGMQASPEMAMRQKMLAARAAGGPPAGMPPGAQRLAPGGDPGLQAQLAQRFQTANPATQGQAAMDPARLERMRQAFGAQAAASAPERATPAFERGGVVGNRSYAKG